MADHASCIAYTDLGVTGMVPACSPKAPREGPIPSAPAGMSSKGKTPVLQTGNASSSLVISTVRSEAIELPLLLQSSPPACKPATSHEVQLSSIP
jgi:hypothetical protein